MRQHFVALFMVAASFFIFSDASQAADYPKMTLKLGHMSPATAENPYHAMAMYLQENLPKKSEGNINLEVFHSGQLGRDRELLEALQYGTLDLGVITTSPISNFVPAFGVTDLPYVFHGWDHVESVLTAPWIQDFYKESEKAQLYTFAFIPRGARSVTNSKVAIKTPADMKNLKLRVIESPVFVDTFTALGASAQAMSWGEVFTALQQGTIDGHENALCTIFDERVYEVQKNVSLTEHIFAFTAVMASKSLFDKLPAAVQTLIKETVAEGLPVIAKQQREYEQRYKKMLEEKGMAFNEVEMDLFQAATKPVAEKFASRTPSIKKYYDLILQTK